MSPFEQEPSEVLDFPILVLNLLCHQVLAHLRIGDTEHRFIQSLLEDQLHGLVQLLLVVDHELVEPTDQGVEPLRAQFIQD